MKDIVLKVPGSILLFSTAVSIPAYAQGAIVVEDPTRTATDTFQILAAGDPTPTTVNVPIGAGNTAQEKALAIVREINIVFGNRTGGAIASIDPINPKRVNIRGQVTGSTIRSGQKTTVGAAQFDNLPDNSIATALIDYSGIISGIDSSGDESVFQSSFGFDGFVADSDIFFSTLSNSTLDGLLTDTFNQLLLDIPTVLQPNLSLDLVEDQIAFIFPTEQTNYFVSNFSSDINTFSSLGITNISVPEPSINSVLLLIGLVSIVYIPLKKAIRFRCEQK